MKKLEKWIKTKEDWYPSYEPLKYDNPLNHVSLRVNLYGPYPDNTYLVCVWGADDKGMELITSEEEAKFLYSIIEDFTSEVALMTLGLHHV